MGIDLGELRKGLAETRRYLLSHHLPSEYHRCYSPTIAGRQVHICARCLGIYPGIVAGLLAYFFVFRGFSSLLLVAILPLPALLDWSMTTFTEKEGYNTVRTATGGALGFGYGFGVPLLLFDSKISIVAVGICYALIAGFLLSQSY